jgi:hypothetical protein
MQRLQPYKDLSLKNLDDEVEAAKKYDFYIQKFKLNKKGNFI